MKKLLSSALGALLVATGCSMVTAVQAADGKCSPCLYPIGEVVGWPTANDPRPALSPLFIEAYPETAGEAKPRDELAKEFSSIFAREFGAQVTAQIDQSNKARSFVVSLHVLRASNYQVRKIDGTTDHFFPVTLTLSFTNPLTGEVLTSLSKTHYEVLQLRSDTSPDEIRARSIAAFRTATQGLTREIVAEAKHSFKPFQLKATVKKVWKGYYILDKGLDDGFALDNELEDASGQSIKLVHVAQRYSVATPSLVLTPVKVGEQFGRYSTQKSEDIKKPRAVMLSGASLQDSYANQLFGDLLLDAKAGFALTPVNNDFDLLLSLIDRYTHIGQANVKHSRLLPQLFMKVTVLEPIHFEVPTNIKSATARQIVSRVAGSLIDTSGRVIYGNVGEDTILDVINFGQGFDIAARTEISIKNALLDLAKKFASDLKLKEERFQIESSDLKIADPQGLVPDRASVRVYRDLGGVDGIAGNVLVPLATANVQRADNKVLLADAFPFVQESPAPSSGDIVLLLSDGKPLAGLKRYGFCAVGQAQKGEIRYEPYVPIAFSLTAKHLSSALYTDPDELALRVRELVENRGFRVAMEKKYVKPENCLEPLYKFNRTKTCSGANCDLKVDAGSGFMVKQVGAEPKMQARKEQFDISQPASVSNENPMLAEIIKKTVTNLPIVIQRIN